MARTARQAALICSIDLPALSGDASTPRPWLQALAQELAACDAPVTLTLLDLAPAGYVQSLFSLRHELALRVDASWGRPEAGRPAFAQTLRSQLQLAQDQGVTVTTLAWGDFPLTPHTDLLVKLGISAVRISSAATKTGLLRLKAPAAAAPGQMIRYGLWTVPAVAQWRPGQAIRAIRRPLAVAAEAGLAHLVCDFSQVRLDGSLDSGFRQAVLELTRHRHHGAMQVQTIGQFADSQLPARPSAPAQSILRAA